MDKFLKGLEKAVSSFLQHVDPNGEVANVLIDHLCQTSNRITDQLSAAVSETNTSSNPLHRGCNVLLKSVETTTESVKDTIISHVGNQFHTPSEFAASANADSLSDEELASIIHLLEDVNSENLSPGRAYIINHLSFTYRTLNTRTGSEFDVQRLDKVFKQFGMEIKHVADGTLADVTSVMNEIAEYDFSTLSCLVVIIMSHGGEDNKISAKDGEYSLERKIMYPILRNKSLSSKLKFIVTESCKGDVDPLHEIEGSRKKLTIPPTEAPVKTEELDEKPTATPDNILRFSSCVEGFVSYLTPNNGSIFIATLCEHLERSGLRDDIRYIVDVVIAEVKEKYIRIQIPMVQTNRTEPFVFGHYIIKD